MRVAARLRLTTPMSVDQIALQMGVADSTKYNWLDKMNINSKPAAAPPPQQPTQAQQKPSYEPPSDDELQEAFAQGRAQATGDPFFRVICALYWGEGRLGDIEDLESTSEVPIASSDHNLINLWLKWLKTTDYDNDKTVRVHLNKSSTASPSAVKKHWNEKLRAASLINTDVEVVQVQSKTKKVSKKQKNGSVYVTLYNHKLRALLLGGISYLQALATK